ncbi:MAG: DUF4352 domain-containing protein [Candidatus Micrarchaeia archaeon]
MAKQKVGKIMAMTNKGGQKTEELPVEYTAVGEAYAVRAGRKINLVDAASAKDGDVRVALEDGDMLAAGKGCIIGIQSGIAGAAEDEKERVTLTVFPESEARISIRKSTTNESGSPVVQNRLSSVELVRGLFSVLVVTEGKIEDRLIIPSGYPRLEFKPMLGEFRGQKTVAGYIELCGGGTLTLFGMMNRVAHRALGVEADAIVDGGVKVTATRDALYSTHLNKHPDARVAAVQKHYSEIGGAALLTGTRVKAKKEKWKAPVLVQRQSRESMAAEAKEQLEAAQESGDEDLIEAAKQQMKAAETYTGEPSGAEMEAIREAKARGEREMAAQAQKARALLSSPLPSYSPPSDDEKIVRKDVKRKAKNYDMLAGDLITREAELKEKYMKGKPTGAQALAYEMEMMKARQQLEDGVKAAAQNRGLAAETASAEIGETLEYRGMTYEILRAEKGTELGFSKSPQGKEFLLVHMRVSNNAKSDAYMDPDNACSLAADGAQAAPVNYEIKTDFAPGAKREGFVAFVVPQDAKGFTFQLGMKGEKKLAVGFKL